jgi:hypothetical protein
MSMFNPLVLLLVLAPASSVLSPEAVEYNTKAMRFYDAGRLQSILQEHVDALTAAYPDDLDRLETRSARARHEEATKQLAAFGPGACDPPPPVVAAAILPVTESAPPDVAPVVAAPLTPPSDNPIPRRLQIAGGVMLPLGLVALAVVVAVSGDHRRDLAGADALQAELALRPCTDDDRARMRELLAATRREEAVMIALGVTGGALMTAGTALLIRGGLQRRRARLALDMRQDRVGLIIAGEF